MIFRPFFGVWNGFPIPRSGDVDQFYGRYGQNIMLYIYLCMEPAVNFLISDNGKRHAWILLEGNCQRGCGVNMLILIIIIAMC